MNEIRARWKGAIAEALSQLLSSESGDQTPITAQEIIAEIPPRPDLGDLAFPMHSFAKRFRMSPVAIGEKVRSRLAKYDDLRGQVSLAGPYLNVLLPREEVSRDTVEAVLAGGDRYGQGDSLAGKRIMVEFSCPNTNKPLHLGHLRNDAIGESVSRLLGACAAEVRKVNLINDRGVHICKSMAAYQRFGDEQTPVSTGKKSDHFVGDYYVRYAQWEQSDPQAEVIAREMLRKWEKGDPAILALWKRMNEWAISGVEETYRRTGISFDAVYHESETYADGKKAIEKGLSEGLFYREPDGSVWIDLSDIDLDKKLLLRSDGTSVYITQDIGTAMRRNEDWPFDRLIYVVAAEQEYHFTVLFQVLSKLGFPWAENLHHLSYGMVNLPEGKMKSREGTVVDADDLLDQLEELAAREIRDKERESEVEDLPKTAADIARGAVNYFLLQVGPTKDMVFNPSESISFTGDTGPYLQYMGARISSMVRKFEQQKEKYKAAVFDPSLVQPGDEWDLVKAMMRFPDMVEQAARELSPSIMANYLHELARTYSRYYHDNPVLHNDDPDLVVTRMGISRAVLQVLRNGMRLLAIPFLERM